MPSLTQLLIVGCDEKDLTCLREILAGSSWKIQKAGSSVEARACLKRGQAPVMLCERELPDGDWKSLLAAVQDLPNPPQVIVTSRNADNLLWAGC